MSSWTRRTANGRRALALLTIVPAGDWSDEEVTAATAAWFPAVGLIIGAAGWGVVHGARVAGWDGRAPAVMAALLLAAWAAVTRLLHWDGLADTADGLLGGSTPAHRLEIMRDSVNGSFAIVTIVFTVAIQLAALTALIEMRGEAVLLGIPALSRLSAVFAAWLGTPVPGSGLGASVMGRPTAGAVLTCALWTSVAAASFVLSLGGGVIAWVGLGSAVLAAMAVPHLLSVRIEGVNGDVMGASILIVETICIAYVALSAGT